MKNSITYLKALWSWGADSQSKDVSHDCRRSDLRHSPSELDAKLQVNSFMRFAVVLTLIFTIGVGNVWGADPATGSWTFNSALAKGWTKVKNGESYCGGGGCKKSVESYTVRTTDNVSDFTTILTDPSNSNFSLTITVTGVCNSGTNKCTVTLLNSSNTKVDSLEQTKLDGFGSGTSAKAAKDVVFTFAPTSTVARIQVIGYNKTAITKVSYSLSYTSGPACSDPATALSISASPASITTDGTSTLSTTGGNGGTVTYTITSANASSASIVENTFSATAAGTYTVQASQDENGGTCGGTATVNITVRYQVKWSVNGNDSYTTGSPTTYIGTHDTKVATLPTSPASGLCDGSKVFVGWTATPIVGTTNTIPTDLFTTAAGSPNVTDNVTYYAVFATVGTATFQASDITNTPATGNTREWGHTASGTLLYLSAGQYYTGGTPYTWTVTAGTSNYARFTAGSGKTITQIVVTISGTNYKINSVTEGTLSTSSTTQTITGINNSTVDCKATSSYQIRITQAVVTYASAFATSCCTALGTINGLVSMGSTSATLTWDKANVSSWAVTCKNTSTSAAAGSVGTITTNGAGKKTCTITDLTCGGTGYTFTISATAASGYCDNSWELTGSTTACTDPAITVSPASLTGLNYIVDAGPSVAQSFTVSGANLNTNLVVSAPTNYEVCKTADGTYTSTISYTPSDGAVANTTAYIRLAAGLNVGTYNYAAASGLQVTSTGAKTRTAALNGSVTKADCAITFTDFNAVDHYEATLEYGSRVTVSYNYTYNGDGNFSISRSPATGTIDKANKTLTVSTAGIWTLNASATAGTNYSKPSDASAQIRVKCVDTYKDFIHNKTIKAYGSGTAVTDGKMEDWGSGYTVPYIDDNAEETSGSCQQTHYKFMGWVSEDDINIADGTFKTGWTLIQAGTESKLATTKTYYAVWAKLEE